MLTVREDLKKHNDSLGSKDWEGNGNSLQWQPTWCWSTVRKSHGQRSLVGCSPWGRTESDRTERLHFPFLLHTLEKEMATHSSVLAWRISGTGEPGGMPSMGSHRVRHNWSDLAAERREQLGSLGWCGVCMSEHTWACVCIGGLMH